MKHTKIFLITILILTGAYLIIHKFLVVDGMPLIHHIHFENESKKEFYEREYNNRLEPSFCIDTLNVPDPRILVIDSTYYIISNKYLSDTTNLDLIIAERLAIRCCELIWYTGFPNTSPPYYNKKLKKFFDRHVNINEYFTSEFAILEFKHANYKLYSFKKEYVPETFLLMCMATKIKPIYSLISGTDDQYSDDDLIGMSYNCEYMLVLAPIYPLDLCNYIRSWTFFYGT